MLTYSKMTWQVDDALEGIRNDYHAWEIDTGIYMEKVGSLAMIKTVCQTKPCI